MPPDTYEDMLDFTIITTPDGSGYMHQTTSGSSPADRRITPDNLVSSYLQTGWVTARETWTYVSSTSFKISGADVSSKYEMGMLVRFKQGGGYKYFAVVAVSYGAPDTTITVWPLNSSDTVANSAITDNYFAVTRPIGLGAYGAALAIRPSDPSWITFTPTCTYASSTPPAFTVAGDYTTVFRIGTKIGWKQTSWKFGYVVASSYSAPNTTVTVCGGSDYGVANAVISEVVLCQDEATPGGFPEWFNWAPTTGGYSANPTSTVYRFKIVGRTCILSMMEGGNGTSNATTTTYTLPVTARTIANQQWAALSPECVDNGSAANNAMAVIASAGTLMNCYKNGSGAAWTGSGSKRFSTRGFMISYEI